MSSEEETQDITEKKRKERDRHQRETKMKWAKKRIDERETKRKEEKGWERKWTYSNQPVFESYKNWSKIQCDFFSQSTGKKNKVKYKELMIINVKY